MNTALTFAEKVIARHAGRTSVAPGELVGVGVDLVVSDELSFPEVMSEFEALGAKRLFDGSRIAIVADHETPARTVLAANNMKRTRKFADRYGVGQLFDAGTAGIIHVLIPETGLIAPGEIMMGYDSHVLTAGALAAFAVGVGATDTAVAMAFGEMWLRVPESVQVTIEGTPDPWAGPKDVSLQIGRELGQSGCLYQAIEYGGSYVVGLNMDGRLTLTNMAIEIGAKSAAINCDQTTVDYMDKRLDRPYSALWADPDAHYAAAYAFDVTGLQPMVSLPDGPDRGVPVAVAAGQPVDQVFIGSCTNGRLSDLRVAAEVLRGRRVNKRTRLLVVPGSPEVLRAAVAEGLVAQFLEAGAVIAPPGCGPCAGLHLGVLADGEVCVATSSRNFPGRMGGGSVYLAGPAVAASTAVAGEIAAPSDLPAPPQPNVAGSATVGSIR
jgi:3-isopropylmalate/(R)-2-methylmalate dehydratase large subunit